MIFEYDPRGVCSRHFVYEIEDNKVKSLQIIGGCHGNTQGISRLVQDMDIDVIISKLKGIDCHGKGTSCPDQIAEGLIAYKNNRQ